MHRRAEEHQCYFMALCFKLLFGSRELPYNYLSPILSLEELLQLKELLCCLERVFRD